jgi:hypothetical protein
MTSHLDKETPPVDGKKKRDSEYDEFYEIGGENKLR